LQPFNTTFSEFSKHIVDRVSTAATRGKETTMHDDLDLAERASVAVSFESVSSLISFYLERDEVGFSPPLVLGRDIRRQLGEREGFDIWRELMFEYEPRLREEELLPGDQRKAITSEQYNAALVEQWQRYGQGEMHWTEMLLVDAMASARADGWKIAEDMFFVDDLDAEISNPTPVRVATEAILDDLARRSGAKRAAVEADWSAACKAEDEAFFAEIEKTSLPLGMPMPPHLHAVPAAPLPDLLTSSAEFVGGFVPPEYRAGLKNLNRTISGVSA
jgi:hypothetical protein